MPKEFLLSSDARRQKNLLLRANAHRSGVRAHARPADVRQPAMSVVAAYVASPDATDRGSSTVALKGAGFESRVTLTADSSVR
jgi:hypothetical protein